MSGGSTSSISSSSGTKNIVNNDNTEIVEGTGNAITFNTKSTTSFSSEVKPEIKTQPNEIINNKNIYSNKAQVATSVTATYESEPNSILFKTPIKSDDKDKHINFINIDSNKSSKEPEILSNIANSIVSGLSGLGSIVVNAASVITSPFFSKEQLTETYKKDLMTFISSNKDDIDFLVDALLPNNDAKIVDDFLHKLEKPNTNIESVTPEVKKSLFKLLDDSEKLKSSLSNSKSKSKNALNIKSEPIDLPKLNKILTNLKGNEQFKELSLDNSFENIYKNFTSSSSSFFDNFLQFGSKDKSEKNSIDESKNSIEKLISLAEKINLPKTEAETKTESEQSKILVENKASIEKLISIIGTNTNSDNNIEKLKSFLNGDKTLDFKDIRQGLQDVLAKSNALPKDKIGNSVALIKDITSKNSKLLEENTNSLSNNISKLRDFLSKGNIAGNEEAENNLVELLINSENLIKSLPKEEASKMETVIGEIKAKNTNLVEKVERRNQLKENYEKSKVAATSAVEELKKQLSTIKDPKLQRLLSNLINAGYSDAMNNPFLAELFASGANHVLELLSNPNGLKPSEVYKNVTDYCSKFIDIVDDISKRMPKEGEKNPNPNKVASHILRIVRKNKEFLNQGNTNNTAGNTLTDRIEFMFKNPETVANTTESKLGDALALAGGIDNGVHESKAIKGTKMLITKSAKLTEQINDTRKANIALADESPKEINDSYNDFKEKIVNTNILSEVTKTQENKINDFFNYFKADVDCISARQDLVDYINNNSKIIDNILKNIDSNIKPIEQINPEEDSNIDEIYSSILNDAIKDAENAESILNSMEFEVDNNLCNGVQLLEKFRDIIVELDLGLRAISQKSTGRTKIDVDFMREINETKKRKEKLDKVMKILKRDFDNSIEVKSGSLSNAAKKAILRNDLKMISLFIQEMNASKQAIGFDL